MSARRRLLGFALVAGAVGCASMGTPPGGAEVKTPVKLLAISPESGKAGFNGRAVELRYDRVVNDRGTGEQSLERQIIISPRDGDPRVSWGRTRVAVRPRKGWRANTTYTVTVLPGITDLRGNRDSTEHVIVFSTGPSLATASATGHVFSWIDERPLTQAWIEAVSRPDSSLVYVARADEDGNFTVGPLPPGEYTIRGFGDKNNNRGLDRGELWDSVHVRIASAGTPVELLAALRDTIAPRLEAVAITDSVTLALRFDRALDPAQPIGPALVRVMRADSTPVPVAGVFTRAHADSLRARAEAERAAASDTAAKRAPAAPVVRPPAATTRDTTRGLRPPPPKPSRPAPPVELVVNLDAALQPGATYRVTAVNVRNLVGRTGTISRIIQVPKPAAPKDTTKRAPVPVPGRASPDSARRVPLAPPTKP